MHAFLPRILGLVVALLAVPSVAHASAGSDFSNGPELRAESVDPVTDAAQPATEAAAPAEPVTEAAEPVVEAAAPAEPVVEAAAPVEPVVEAAEPVVDGVGSVDAGPVSETVDRAVDDAERTVESVDAGRVTETVDRAVDDAERIVGSVDVSDTAVAAVERSEPVEPAATEPAATALTFSGTTGAQPAAREVTERRSAVRDRAETPVGVAVASRPGVDDGRALEAAGGRDRAESSHPRPDPTPTAPSSGGGPSTASSAGSSSGHTLLSSFLPVAVRPGVTRRLLSAPDHWRPVQFVSLLERPG